MRSLKGFTIIEVGVAIAVIGLIGLGLLAWQSTSSKDLSNKLAAPPSQDLSLATVTPNSSMLTRSSETLQSNFVPNHPYSEFITQPSNKTSSLACTPELYYDQASLFYYGQQGDNKIIYSDSDLLNLAALYANKNKFTFDSNSPGMGFLYCQDLPGDRLVINLGKDNNQFIHFVASSSNLHSSEKQLIIDPTSAVCRSAHFVVNDQDVIYSCIYGDEGNLIHMLYDWDVSQTTPIEIGQCLTISDGSTDYCKYVKDLSSQKN